MAAEPGRMPATAGIEDGDNYLASVSDLMVGMLFVFIIMLMAFALNYRSAEEQAEETRGELEAETVAVLSERDAIARERDLLAQERDLLAQERDKLAAERDGLRLQRDELGAITNRLVEGETIRGEMLASIQELLGERDVLVEIIPENGILRLPESLLFDTAEAVLRPEGERALEALADVLSETLACHSAAPEGDVPGCPGNGHAMLEAVLIEGHTDDRPISTLEFQDNWELAGARAVNTYKALTAFNGALERLKNGNGQALLGVSAYEARRPVTADRNDGALRQNRRIDMRFLMAAPSEAELAEIRNRVAQDVPASAP